MSELKPCPFCGNEEVEPVIIKKSEWKFAVTCYCTSCGATGGTGRDDAAAIKAWNRRIHEAEPDIPIFDKETRIENCTVQIQENTKTGRVSIGWWRNDE